MIFGNQKTFAVECEIDVPSDEFFNCKICLWAGGIAIGDFERGSSLRVSRLFFRNTLKYIGQRHDSTLNGKSTDQVLQFVYKTLYEIPDEDKSLEELELAWQRYGKFHICPDGGPAFDGWLAVLLEEQAKDRFIWSYELQDAEEVSLMLGEYEQVMSSFLVWAEGIIQDK